MRKCWRCAGEGGHDGVVASEADCPHPLDACRNDNRGCAGIAEEIDGFCPDCIEEFGSQKAATRDWRAARLVGTKW